MPKTIFVQLSRPSSSNPAGVTACGEYEIARGTITLTKFNGEALTADRRKRFSQKLNKGDKPHVIAGRLTKDYAFSLHNRPFSAPINYPPIRVA